MGTGPGAPVPGVRMGVLGAQTLRVVLRKATLVSGDLTLPCWQKAPEAHPYWGHSNLPVCTHVHVCVPV